MTFILQYCVWLISQQYCRIFHFTAAILFLKLHLEDVCRERHGRLCLPDRVIGRDAPASNLVKRRGISGHTDIIYVRETHGKAYIRITRVRR